MPVHLKYNVTEYILQPIILIYFKSDNIAIKLHRRVIIGHNLKLWRRVGFNKSVRTSYQYYIPLPLYI